jgi:hypothetical protein
MPTIKTKSGLQEYTVGEPVRVVTLKDGTTFSVTGSIAQSAVQLAYDKGQPQTPAIKAIDQIAESNTRVFITPEQKEFITHLMLIDNQ